MVVCSFCASSNDDGSSFCEECGSALAMPCPSCGTPATPGKRFCRSCGSPLLRSAAPPAPPETTAAADPSRSAPVAERRVCSVLFCDLVGFTTLSESRDPEDVRELLSEYFDGARTVVERYGGVVEKFIGDAVMAVWGTPTAMEEDAERAVRAGLDLVDAVAELGRDRQMPGLAARAGLVTGPVAVTLGATGQGMVAGDAVNTAARVQAEAEPGTVLVDEASWRAASAAIAFAPPVTHHLKGKAQPVRLWQAGRVLSGVGGAQRIDGLEARFVGRDTELRLVKELFHACAQRKTPRLVSVTGAAGVGKTRLGWEFEKYIDGLADTVYWHRGKCLSYGEGVAFWALAEMVRQRLDIAEEDASSVAADKLHRGLGKWLADESERAYIGPRLAQLLGTVTDESAPLGQEELFAGWRLFFERLAEVAPVVMVVEDLQHADAGFLDFLEHLLDWARDVPIFVLTLARSELETRRAGWATGRRNGTTLTLDPLDEAALMALLEGLVPGMPVPAKALVAGRAEGIPLYAVETVRMLIDRDVVQPVDGVYRLVGDVGELAVPATLQSLLAARFDTLAPDARRLIADAAVLGGSFPAEALVAVSGQPDAEVRRLLAELVRREVLAVRADPLSPQRGHYGFVQTMFRQVAYDTLSRRERKARHLAVAAHLRGTFADGGEEVAEVVATHLLDALAAVPDDPDVLDLRDQAVNMLTLAAERAQRTGAPVAAAAALTKAANLLQEGGSADSELAAASLLERAGANANTAGDFPVALEKYQRASVLYRQRGHDRATARAETNAGAVLRRLGRFDDARAQFDRARAVLTEDPDEDTVMLLAALATLEAFTGNADMADRISAAALAEAQALDVSESVLADLFVVRGIAHGLADRVGQAAANLREAVLRAESLRDNVTAARALLNLGDAVVTVDVDAAVDANRTAMTLSRRMGSRDAMGYAAANLIQALLMTGDWSAAEQVYVTGVRDDGLHDNSPLAFSAALLLAFSGDPRLADVLPSVSLKGGDDPQDVAATATALAAAAAMASDHSEALAQARSALHHGEGLSIRSDAVRWAWSLAADAALKLGDDAEVTRLLSWLEAHRPGHIPPVLRAEGRRVRALLLSMRGEPSAGSTFEAAVKALRTLGSPYHLTVGLLDFAEHHTASGNREGAESLALEALAIARRLNARPLLQRAQDLTGSVDAEATEAASHY